MKRPPPIFTESFLDALFCAFGAVSMLVIISIAQDNQDAAESVKDTYFIVDVKTEVNLSKMFGLTSDNKEDLLEELGSKLPSGFSENEAGLIDFLSSVRLNYRVYFFSRNEAHLLKISSGHSAKDVFPGNNEVFNSLSGRTTKNYSPRLFTNILFDRTDVSPSINDLQVRATGDDGAVELLFISDASIWANRVPQGWYFFECYFGHNVATNNPLDEFISISFEGTGSGVAGTVKLSNSVANVVARDTAGTAKVKSKKAKLISGIDQSSTKKDIRKATSKLRKLRLPVEYNGIVRGQQHPDETVFATLDFGLNDAVIGWVPTLVLSCPESELLPSSNSTIGLDDFPIRENASSLRRIGYRYRNGRNLAFFPGLNITGKQP